MVPVVGQPGEVVQQVGALPPADGPLGDVVRPDVGRHGGGGLAVAVGKRKNDKFIVREIISLNYDLRAECRFSIIP